MVTRKRLAQIASPILISIPPLAALAFLVWTHLLSDPVRRAAEGASAIRWGDPIPEIQLEDVRGETRTLADLVSDGGAAIVIVDPRCPHCHTELEAIRAIVAREPAPRRLVVVSRGAAAGVRELRDRYPELPIHADPRRALTERYGLRSIPLLVVVEGRTVTDVRAGVQGRQDLEEMLGFQGRR